MSPFATVTPLREWASPVPSSSPLARAETLPAAAPPSADLVAEVAARLDAGTLVLDCPSCGESMMTKRDKRGLPYAYCYACRHDVAGRTAPAQRYWIRLAVARLERERESAR